MNGTKPNIVFIIQIVLCQPKLMSSLSQSQRRCTSNATKLVLLVQKSQGRHHSLEAKVPADGCGVPSMGLSEDHYRISLSCSL